MGAKDRVNIAIFASGAGTNAARLIGYFNQGEGQSVATISLVVSNKPEAGVNQVAKSNGIELLLIEKERFFRGDAYLHVLEEKNIQLIVLAGFIWKIPSQLISHFPHSIINIHPALLPKYGGKGMFGMNVHNAVLEARETQSGITIHYVDGQYDNGDIIFQATCDITPGETVATLVEKIHSLEYTHFPRVVEEVASILRSAT
jgi:phosphoribosylglycinamide formyltransferase 1